MSDRPGPSATLAVDPDEYRAALRAHLAAAPELARFRDRQHVSTETRIAEDAALMSALAGDGGWNLYGWPEKVGGLGGDERHRGILYDELARSGLPVPEPHLLLETLCPAITAFSPHLAARYAPAYLRGQEWWGQCFSEPDAGSDLAALRTRARRDGDHYVVSGQKLWTSHGATARRLVALVRTGSTESRHRGLSMIMIDVDSPGVTARPIALASGDNELAEIFFDDVIVPADRLVGEEGQGWTVAMFLLQYERAMFAWQSAAVALRRLTDLRDLLVARSAPIPDGARRRLGATYLDIVTLRARSSQTVRRLAAGETVGPEASVDKVLLAAAEQGLHDLARDLLGPDFLLSQDPGLRAWRAEWWYSRSATILGGSAEVQRTILADHVLGLPKELAR
ncbi:acyl-CoA dehydrogenase family protein [Arsenicicoccus bolidensis]|uniref:acyl-CoA dehydrogenase family protein n=1 Tax=Arsenicicoccus bolidensis TaxID=229480 RepID=UPI0028A81CDB|nr:acyl-CoA dehydrogenase family protein [Arsenicicoccus bolidensis]